MLAPRAVRGTLPPLLTIAAALRKTTEFLARELVAPTADPPLWTDFEWRIARAVVSMHGIYSLLHAGLRWREPESWRQFLAEQRDHAVERHLQIERRLDAIDLEARCKGIALVALKGAALYGREIYAAGERPMADIDLLVHPNAVEARAIVGKLRLHRHVDQPPPPGVSARQQHIPARRQTGRARRQSDHSRSAHEDCRTAAGRRNRHHAVDLSRICACRP